MLTVLGGGKPCLTTLGNWIIRLDAVHEGRHYGSVQADPWSIFQGRIYESARSAAQSSTVRFYSASRPRLSARTSPLIPRAVLAIHRPRPGTKVSQSTFTC